jgi:hypothetical protein
MLHWNGRAWQQVSRPRPVTGVFDGVTAVSSRCAFAAGGTDLGLTVARWNGTSWKSESTPGSGGVGEQRLGRWLLRHQRWRGDVHPALERQLLELASWSEPGRATMLVEPAREGAAGLAGRT